MTKGELAQRILRAIGVNTRFSDANPTEIEDVLYMAEDWMLANNAMGRRIGWVIADGVPDPDDPAGIPEWAVLGATYGIAELVCPYFGKQMTPDMLRLKAQGMQTITNRTTEVQTVQYPRRFPRGQANGSPFDWKYYQPVDRIITKPDFLTDEGDDPITS